MIPNAVGLSLGVGEEERVSNSLISQLQTRTKYEVRGNKTGMRRRFWGELWSTDYGLEYDGN